jgi:hypothetical protein
MEPGLIRDFVQRDRAAVEKLKRTHWVRLFRQGGPAATIRAGHALYEHVRRVRDDFPSPRERADDLAFHIELKRKLDRASRALSIR